MYAQITIANAKEWVNTYLSLLLIFYYRRLFNVIYLRLPSAKAKSANVYKRQYSNNDFGKRWVGIGILLNKS
jgi:hypothetical protein